LNPREISRILLIRLREIGDWLKINGEAIYGAGRTPFGDELKASAIKDHHFVYRKPTGWRCTTKPGKLYIHLFEWPNGSFRLEGVDAKVTRARLLADPKRKLKVTQEAGAVTITLPGAAPSTLASVIALDYKGALKRP